jgi:hypothetical protein
MVVEKSALKSLFDPICAEYHVALGNCGGSWSINMRANMLKRFAEWQAQGKDCILLYAGDHDPYGLRMSEHLRANLGAILPSFSTTFPEIPDFDLDELEIERFGLNADFIDGIGLTWIENLLTASGKDLSDPDFKYGQAVDVQDYIARHGVRKCEADALVIRPHDAHDLCRQAILKYVEEDGIAEFKERRDELREEMRKAILERIGGDSP